MLPLAPLVAVTLAASNGEGHGDLLRHFQGDALGQVGVVVVQFPGAVKGGGIVVNMDVGVGPVRMGHHKESVFPLGTAHRHLIADVQRLLRVQLPRGEGLADLIAQHIGVPLLLPACNGFVPGLAQKKFAAGGEGGALVGADQGPVQGLFRVLAVV